ncbi:MAG: Hpt domain-containing protein, partial [Caldimicrobium sp.]
MIDEDILKDFLGEAKDGISKMEEEFIELEQDPSNKEILKSLFRTMHSLKGASGFFGFKSLEAIAHFSEDILSKLRDGLIEPEEDIIDILLRALDEIKYIVAYLEEHKAEPVEDRILEFLVELSNFSEKLKKREGTKKEDEVKEEEAKVESEEVVEEKALISAKEEAKGDVSVKEEAPKEEKGAPLSPQVQLTETHIKVDVKLLDTLMNLAGELVLA